jgi:hypothetical protein
VICAPAPRSESARPRRYHTRRERSSRSHGGVTLDLHPTFFLANRGGFFAAALTIAVEFF